MRLIYTTIIIGLLLGGCSLKEVGQKPNNYRLEVNDALHVKKKEDKRILRVQRVEGDSSVSTNAILYKKDGALKPYKFARWSELPSTRLQQIITESIQKQKIFKAAVSSKSFAYADLILESTLENFEEVYEGEQSFIHVKIRFTLVKRLGAKLIDTISIEKKVGVKEKNTQGVVQTFNEATSEILKEMNEWLYAK